MTTAIILSAAYVLSNLIAFIWVRYFYLKDRYRIKDDPYFKNKYGALMKNDLDALGLIKSFPWYQLFWVKFIFGWCIALPCTIFCFITSIGVKDVQKMSSYRKQVVQYFLKMSSHICMFFSGVVSQVTHKSTTADYKHYLGPDWKADWDAAPIIISNHIGYLDAILGVINFYPRFVGRAGVKDMFAIGFLTQCLDFIYVDRFSKDASESKKKVFQAIEKHSDEYTKGLRDNSLLIFPEGTTSNGEQILQFKVGAFSTLCPIKPCITTYERYGGTSPFSQGDVYTTGFILSCSPLNGKVTQVEMPTFRANQYLWDNHLREGETKVKCYMRVIRECMLKESGLKDSPLSANDRQTYFEEMENGKTEALRKTNKMQ